MIDKRDVCVCEQCQHAWLATGELPKRCARCKSSKWNESGVVPEKVVDLDAPIDNVSDVAPSASQTLAGPPPIEQRETPRTTGTLRHIEDVTHAALRKNVPTRKSFPKKTEKKAKSSGKTDKCPHGFFIVDGVT